MKFPLEPDNNIRQRRWLPTLVSDEVYICSSILLMVTWWLPYLAKGPTSDFNNGPGNDSNSACILALQRLFESYYILLGSVPLLAKPDEIWGVRRSFADWQGERPYNNCHRGRREGAFPIIVLFVVCSRVIPSYRSTQDVGQRPWGTGTSLFNS